MSFFKLPRFIRRFVRRHTNEISELKSLTSRKKLSFLYAIVTWNLFGFIIYTLYKEKQNRDPTATTTRKRWWEGGVYGMDQSNIKRYRLSGFALEELKDTEKTASEKENEELKI